MKHFVFPLMITLTLLISCKEETACDTAGYALPEITLVSPESADFEVQSDSLHQHCIEYDCDTPLIPAFLPVGNIY